MPHTVPPSPGPWVRLVASVMSRPAVQRQLMRTQQRLDEAVFDLTGGRTTLAALGSGLDVMVLETIGARTGQVRRAVLLAVPDPVRGRGHFLVAGSNFGQQRHPGWVYNLRAHPVFIATLRGRTTTVRAQELTGADRDCAWEAMQDGYPGMRAYEQTAAPRLIPMFRISAAPIDASPADRSQRPDAVLLRPTTIDLSPTDGALR